MTSMTRNSLAPLWILVHLGPLLLVPLVTHSLHTAIGIDRAAAVGHLIILSWIAAGETYLLRSLVSRPRAWAWRTAFGLAIAVVAGLVVMSTIDLRGYDALATVFGMVAAGLVLGVVQAPAQRRPSWRWVVASLVGWLVGAFVFRLVVLTLAGMSLGGFKPFALAYNAGHNELLWLSVGVAFHGLATVWNVTALARS